jgi:hypothetical protein
MNTVVNIPWNAVVDGDCARSSQQQAKELPLVVSRNFDGRSNFNKFDGEFFVRLLTKLPTDQTLSVGRRYGQSMRVESLLYGDETNAIVSLTSDGESSVVLQALWSSWVASETHDPALAIDALIHSYILRYAWFDADLRAFVLPDDEAVASDGCGMHFIRPENWGFRPITSGASAWTASRPELTSPATMRNAYCTTKPVLLPPFRSPFETPQSPDRGDPFQCLPPLRHSRQTLEKRLCSTTIAPQAEELCYWPALALGRCRLFGVKVEDETDFTLAPEAFLHASSHLIRHLRGLIRWSREVEELRNRGGACVDQNLAIELLEIRTDAHATCLALDEAYAAALYEGLAEAPAMGRRMHQVRRLIDILDGNLRKSIPLLRLAASTQLLKNWRRLLAPEYREMIPWWMGEND